MIVLLPMSVSEYLACLAEWTPRYAAQKVTAGQWTEGEALGLAQATFKDLLPDGLATVDNHLFKIWNDAESVAVGFLWIAARERSGQRIAYVYEMGIEAEHRRKGYARSAFIALEHEVRTLGLAGVELHVFGHNSAAQALYAKLGYQPTSIVMYKPLAD